MELDLFHLDPTLLDLGVVIDMNGKEETTDLPHFVPHRLDLDHLVLHRLSLDFVASTRRLDLQVYLLKLGYHRLHKRQADFKF